MKSPAQLTEEQEELRREGLRILARIIARHYIEHPERYPDPVDAVGASGKSGDQGLAADSLGRESDREDGR